MCTPSPRCPAHISTTPAHLQAALLPQSATRCAFALKTMVRVDPTWKHAPACAQAYALLGAPLWNLDPRGQLWGQHTSQGNCYACAACQCSRDLLMVLNAEPPCRRVAAVWWHAAGLPCRSTAVASTAFAGVTVRCHTVVKHS